MSKENFKFFASRNSNLANHVNSGNMTWQKFYEMYELYGENHNVWNEYINTNDSDDRVVGSTKIVTKETTIRDLVNMVKGIELEKVQKGVEGIQKTISLIQDMGVGAATKVGATYEPRPIYKHFGD